MGNQLANNLVAYRLLIDVGDYSLMTLISH